MKVHYALENTVTKMNSHESSVNKLCNAYTYCQREGYKIPFYTEPEFCILKNGETNNGYTDNKNIVQIIKKGIRKNDLSLIAVKTANVCKINNLVLLLHWVSRYENAQADKISKIVDFDDLPLIFLLGCTISFISGVSWKCPHPSQRLSRISVVCNGNISLYTCLYDTRKAEYTEFCSPKDDYVRSGLKYVITGTFRNVVCSDGRYQPIRFWSNRDTDCLFSKTKCSEIGQLMHDNKSTENDATCRCDYTNGYAFVSQPINRCFCIPSQEDCSCYNKQCPDRSILSPGKKLALRVFVNI
ncbi:unnamed protein product [Mytilus coruscus]|uniref:Uncharacterized protein n=1 Tax=Mytilus coruscus TaxID=42192 RepID=A0A6J8CTF5_MYTCO|nr:unnamed protein product [Mytilus coruscus]